MTRATLAARATSAFSATRLLPVAAVLLTLTPPHLTAQQVKNELAGGIAGREIVLKRQELGVTVTRGSRWSGKFSERKELRSVEGRVEVVSVRLTTPANPSISLTFDTAAAHSSRFLAAGDLAVGPTWVVAADPARSGGIRFSDLGQQFLPGYVYRRDDGRRAWMSFINEPLEFALIFVLPKGAPEPEAFIWREHVRVDLGPRAR
jgi:hypothetical protein